MILERSIGRGLFVAISELKFAMTVTVGLVGGWSCYEQYRLKFFYENE